jgi:hypothetical protein
MSNPWLQIDLDIENSLKVDIKDYILSNPQRQNEVAIYKPEEIGIWRLDPETIFKDDFLISLYEKYNLVIGTIQCFMRKPNYQHPGAHCDMLPNGTVLGAALNWCLGEDSSEMVWYEYPDVDPNTLNDSNNYVDYEWPVSVLKETHRHVIGNIPTLVRTDLPHTIDMKDHERWCVSLRFHNDLGWQQCVDKVK